MFSYRSLYGHRFQNWRVKERKKQFRAEITSFSYLLRDGGSSNLTKEGVLRGYVEKEQEVPADSMEKTQCVSGRCMKPVPCSPPVLASRRLLQKL